MVLLRIEDGFKVKKEHLFRFVKKSFSQQRFHSPYLVFGISFLLQRIISHLALSCVIIFLYLKRGREGRCLQRPMCLFELFGAAYGDGLYQSIPDGIGGTDIVHNGMVVDHMNPEGVLHSHGMAFHFSNVQGDVDVISDGQLVPHTELNIMGRMDVYDGDMGLEHMTMPNVHGGVDIYDANMNMDGMTMLNVFGGEDYFAMQGTVDIILEYQDPVMHSGEHHMESFVFVR